MKHFPRTIIKFFLLLRLRYRMQLYSTLSRVNLTSTMPYRMFEGRALVALFPSQIAVRRGNKTIADKASHPSLMG